MATNGFCFCLILSIIVLICTGKKNYENVNIYDWTIMIIIPIIILGYWLKSRVTTPEAAELAFCFIYLDSSVMLMVTLFAMMHAFSVHIKWWWKIVGYGAAYLHAAVVWLSFGTGMYYSTMTVTVTDAGSVTKMTAGPLKVIHIIYLIAVMAIMLGFLVRMYIIKGTHSRVLLHSYSIIAILFIIIYGVESLVDVDFTILPYLYVLCQTIIMLNYDHIRMHDISCVISNQQNYFSANGYIVLDLNQRFMSCTQKAYEFQPVLRKQRVDDALPKNITIFREMIESFINEKIVSKKVVVDGAVYMYEIAEFSMRKDGRKQGYLFTVHDATDEQKAMDVMNEYNKTLSAEVEEKTEHIIDIQRKITVGMANIIDSRDNNTGGHVRRTSDVIGIIINEMMSQSSNSISKQMAEAIVRSAPLHDLGKITIDSSILCKPGKLSDEEYEIMKTHSVKSGEMVHILLDGIEEQQFVNIAYNIARFHHERWDGKGYPEGLVGTMIPIEARIMAIADVYDALVSKRCYKESMSYEKASEIMLDGMGTQFDPNLKKIFLSCREKLEEYYKTTRR